MPAATRLASSIKVALPPEVPPSIRAANRGIGGAANPLLLGHGFQQQGRPGAASRAGCCGDHRQEGKGRGKREATGAGGGTDPAHQIGQTRGPRWPHTGALQGSGSTTNTAHEVGFSVRPGQGLAKQGGSNRQGQAAGRPHDS